MCTAQGPSGLPWAEQRCLSSGLRGPTGRFLTTSLCCQGGSKTDPAHTACKKGRNLSMYLTSF